MSIIEETLKRTNLKKTPVWMMRQAGRHLPEYRKIREAFPSLLEMFLNSEVVAEVTLQPTRRYNIDAAIIFSDILMVPHTLQAKINFNKETQSPTVEIDFKATQKIENANPVFEAIKIVKSRSNIPLIGFSGGPWTTIYYCLFNTENRKKNIEEKIKQAERQIDKLVDKFTVATIEYVLKQIDSGINIFQLFESWSGLLNDDQFEKWCIQPAVEIFREVKNKNIPTIGFPRGASKQNYVLYSNIKNLNCVSLDHNFNLNHTKELNQNIAYQGNLNPLVLMNGGEALSNEIEKILLAFDKLPHIFNLGHGILPNTPTRNVEQMITQIKSK